MMHQYRRAMRCWVCGWSWSGQYSRVLVAAVGCPNCRRWTGLPAPRRAPDAASPMIVGAHPLDSRGRTEAVNDAEYDEDAEDRRAR